jgi:hypothetical protein
MKVDRPKRARGVNGTKVEKFAAQSVHRLAVVAYKVRFSCYIVY